MNNLSILARHTPHFLPDNFEFTVELSPIFFTFNSTTIRFEYSLSIDAKIPHIQSNDRIYGMRLYIIKYLDKNHIRQPENGK